MLWEYDYEITKVRLLHISINYSCHRSVSMLVGRLHSVRINEEIRYFIN